MVKRYFDIKTGHYILKEDSNENVSQGTGMDDATNPNNNNSQDANKNMSVETNTDIQQINTDLSAESKRYDDQKASENQKYNQEKTVQTNLLNAAMAAVTDAGGTYDSVQTNSNVLNIKKKILDIEYQHVQRICNLELDHAKRVFDIENKRINVLNGLANESYNTFPGKYSSLNESNVHNAKIYLDILIGDGKIIGGMPDFKNAFKDSELIYGKDKKGYYVVCIDREDFDRLYVVLGQNGYRRDEVFSVVMSQVLDRTDLLTGNNNS